MASQDNCLKLKQLCRKLFVYPYCEDEPTTLELVQSLAEPKRPNKNRSSQYTLKERNMLLLQLTTISTFVKRTDDVAELSTILESLVDQDNLSLALIDLLLLEDPYLSYGSMKCLLSLLCTHSKEPQHWQFVLIQDVVASVAAQSFTRLDLAFTFAKKLLEKNKNLALKCHTVTTVCSCWRFFFAVVMDTVWETRAQALVDIDINKAGIVLTFLKLWKRVLKFKLNTPSVKEEEDESMIFVPERVYYDLFQLSPKLLDLLWYTKQSYIIQSRALDVMNDIITYQGATDRETEQIYKLAKAVIAAINNHVYDGIDLNRYVTFGWSKVQPNNKASIKGTITNQHIRCNKFMLRKITLLACNAGMENLDDSQSHMNNVIEALENTSALGDRFTQLEKYHSRGLLYWIKNVFDEQDDDWIQVMLSLLSITIDQRQLKYEGKPGIRAIEIHYIVNAFFDIINYDSTLLLDLIVSPRTAFRPFFTKYLKFLMADWNADDLIEYSVNFSDIESAQSKIFAPEASEPKHTESKRTESSGILLSSKKDIPKPWKKEPSAKSDYDSDSYTYYSYDSRISSEDRNKLPESFDNFIFFETMKACAASAASSDSADDGVSSATTDPSYSSLEISHHTCNMHDMTAHVLDKHLDTKSLMYMFAQLMVSLQRLQKADKIQFNITPIIRLLYTIQKVRPRVLPGYVKMNL